MNTSLAWSDVERITRGRFGVTARAPCPFCSHTRRKANQRKPVFAIKLKEPDFAIYNCVHCGESGYVHPDKPRVIDLAERKQARATATDVAVEDEQRRTARAVKLWDERECFFLSPAENYLQFTRGIGDWLAAFDRIDEALGFHPACPFGGQILPCMLALVRNIETNEPQAIHRTALTSGPVPDRIDRRSLGPTKGGAIKLSPDDEVTHGLLIGEGIETVMSASRLFHFRPCWSVIDANGIRNFPILSGVECLTVAADNDENRTGQNAAQELRTRARGRTHVTTVTPKPPANDFNDIVKKENNND